MKRLWNRLLHRRTAAPDTDAVLALAALPDSPAETDVVPLPEEPAPADPSASSPSIVAAHL